VFPFLQPEVRSRWGNCTPKKVRKQFAGRGGCRRRGSFRSFKLFCDRYKQGVAGRLALKGEGGKGKGGLPKRMEI